MPTKPKNIKSSSKTAAKATKAPAVKKSTKKSPSKKVTVVETVIEDVSVVENTPVFVEALTAPTESQEVAVQADIAQTAVSVNTDTLGGTISEVQTELPFVEATPTPTPALEVDCGNECTCSTPEAAPKKDHTKTILIVAGVIILIALVLLS
jgi:hypothetical protein